MKIIEPAIGRIVHYKIDEHQVRPAMIADVWFTNSVHLQILHDINDDGRDEWKNHVRRGNGIGQWNWPV